MENLPDFETGSPASARSGYASHLRSLGYLVEQAYRRTDGACACGDSSCRKSPHFASDPDAPSEIHLVMRAETVAVTSEMNVVQRALRFGSAVAILRHGGTSYLFLSDPRSLPSVAPVIAPGQGWIALPPYRSDDAEGNYTQPSWISELTQHPVDLPQAVDVFGPSLVSRTRELTGLAGRVRKSIPNGTASPDETVSLKEMVFAACESLLAQGRGEELTSFLAPCCVAGMVAFEDAMHWLREMEELSPSRGVLSEKFTKTLVGVIFAEEELVTREIEELLLDAARRLDDATDNHAADGREEDGGSTGDTPEPLSGGDHFDSSGDVAFERPWATQTPGAQMPVEVPFTREPFREESGFTQAPNWGQEQRSSHRPGHSEEEGSSAARASAVPNWADALERQEAVIYTAALSLFAGGSQKSGTPIADNEAPANELTTTDEIEPIAADYAPGLLDGDAEVEAGPVPDELVSQAEAVLEDAWTKTRELEPGGTRDILPEGEELEPEAENAQADLSLESDTNYRSPETRSERAGEPGASSNIEVVPFEIPVAIDWEAALQNSAMVTPVELVQLVFEMSEFGFSDDELTKLALLDMAITAIPDGTDDPLRLFSYLWPDTGSFKVEFGHHRSMVELLAALLVRYDLACAAGALAGEASLAELAARDGVEFFSDLIGDPELVFYLETRLLNVTTSAQLMVRLSMISKIISAIGVEFTLNLATQHLLSLAGGAAA